MPRDPAKRVTVWDWLVVIAGILGFIFVAVVLGLAVAHSAESMPKLQRGELEMLALVVQRESTGEPELGMKAVAWTVLNRLREPEVYGRTISAVLTRRYQYAAPAAGSDTAPAYLKALHATLGAWLGIGGDPSNGSTHFARCDLRRKPGWMRTFERRAVYGNHCFYRRRN